MKLELEVSECVELVQSLKSDRFFDLLRLDIRKEVSKYLSNLMKTELKDFLGRAPYERDVEGKTNHRNGCYSRSYTLKGVGEVKTDVPRDRNGEFQSKVLPRYQRYESAIQEDLSLLYLSGISTRSLSLISKRLLGRNLSASEVSNSHKDLNRAAENWRERDLSQEKLKYLYIDGVNFSMRVDKEITLVPVLVTIGVSFEGYKMVLGLQTGDKESATCWREFFRDLKARGLKKDHIQLGIMDGLPGLEKVFKEEFPKAKTQRCQVHLCRNVLCKVPQKLKTKASDSLRDIFYAENKKAALKYYEHFVEQYNSVIPGAVQSLKNNILSCLTFFDFPKEEWTALRTTNCIERLNKEFKRRTKPMEIVAGEKPCYLLLAFISLKMELGWRYSPIHKVNIPSLPFLKSFQ